MSDKMENNPLSSSEFELDKLISNKEEEIKNIFYMKIKSLNEALSEKSKCILVLEDKLDKLKSDFNFNFKLIEERDNDLKIFEDKIESFEDLLKEKELIIKDNQKNIEDFNLKLKKEKHKRENNEELLKFNISKLNSNHKEEVKVSNTTIEELQREINNIKQENKNKTEEIKYLSEVEKRKFIEEIDYLNSQLKRNKETAENEEKLKREKEELQICINKVNNENLVLIKDKIHLENKLKLYENNENETKTNNFVISERNKYLTKEIEELKFEISNKSHKIDSANKILEESLTEVNSLKQKIQIKDFDYERKTLSEKLLNEKLRECNYQIEKFIEEKRNTIRATDEDKIKLQSVESKLKTNNEELFNVKYTHDKCLEENKILKGEIENLNKKIKDLINVNSNLNDQMITKDLLKEKNKEDTSDLLDFFTNKNNINNLNQIKENNLELLLREKDLELERINKELEGAKMILMKVESEMSITYNLFKENENKFLEKISRLELELIKKEMEFKNSVHISTSKERDNNLINDLNEIILNYKTEVKLKNDLIAKLKENLNIKITEISRMKKEREKMAGLCISLRAQLNRIENQNECNNENNEYDEYEQDTIDVETNQHNYVGYNSTQTHNHSILSSRSAANYLSEFEEYTKKKNLILSSTRESDLINHEAKRHIENVMTMKEREASVKSNGIQGRNRKTSPNNLKKVQITNLSTRRKESKYKSNPNSRSASNSRSRSPIYNSIYREEGSVIDAMQVTKLNNIELQKENSNNILNKIHNQPRGLKLLKRDRNKSETKY